MNRVLALVGLTLDNAQNVWRERGVSDEDVKIRETSPPVRPPRHEHGTGNASEKPKRKAPSKPPRSPVNFGQLRVLRVVQNEKMEITVAREELKELEPEQETNDPEADM